MCFKGKCTNVGYEVKFSICSYFISSEVEPNFDKEKKPHILTKTNEISPFVP